MNQQIWPPLNHNQDYYDPLLSLYRNPQLYDGVNSTAINGDEANGAGVNEPIWPVLFDTFEPMQPIIITQEMLADFLSDCPDVTIPAETTTVFIPRDLQDVCTGDS